MSAIWFLLSTCLLEAVAVTLLLQGPQTPLDWLVMSLAHAAASLCSAWACWRLLPPSYREPRNWCLGLLFLLGFFMPVVGIAGVLLALLPALHMPLGKRGSPWKRTPIPDLPFRASAPSRNHPVSTGYLHDLLRHALNPDKRLTAILSTRRMNSRDAIPILQLALKDPADDVRLLAYSMLDNLESRINARIKELQGRLQQAETLEQSAAEQATLHAALAQNYWELGYLGLSQGSVLTHMLETAQSHIRQAIELRGSADDWLLAGRIQLGCGRPGEAEAAFQRAGELGMSASKLASFHAELAFLRRDFDAVPQWLGQLGPTAREQQPFHSLVRYWQC